MALLATAMLLVYPFAFLHVEWLTLVYSCTLVVAALGFRRLRRGKREARGDGAALTRRTRTICGVSIGLSSVLFLLAGLVDLHSMTRLTLPYYDQEAYLAGAVAIKNLGGSLAAVGRCFVGGFINTRRDPLFLLLIAPFASEDPAFFEVGKYISLFWGTLAVASAGIVTWKLFNPIAGVTAALCLSMNHFLLKHSALVNCEPFYVFLITWAVYFVMAGGKKRRLWIVGGALTGLANLAKGSGILFMGAFGVAAVVTMGKRVVREKHVYLFFAAFFAVCLPFMVDTAVKYGNPFYNPNAKLMWADCWDEAQHLTPEQLQTMGFLPYLRTHTFQQAWARLWGGFQAVSDYFLSTGELRVMLLKYAHGTPVVLLALLALAYDEDRFRQVFFLAVVPVFYLLVGWLWGIGTSERHVLPLVPFVFAYFGDFLSKACIAPESCRERATRRVALGHAVAGAMGIVLMLVMKGHRIFTTT